MPASASTASVSPAPTWSRIATQAPQGFHVLLGVDSEDRVRSLFDSLQPGGQAILAPQKTFWSPCYAIVVDRFGVPWKINCVPGA